MQEIKAVVVAVTVVLVVFMLSMIGVGVIRSASLANDVGQLQFQPKVNCGNPCIISIVNAQFGNGRPVVVHQGTTVIWSNKDPIPYTGETEAAQEYQELAFVLEPGYYWSVVYNNLGQFEFSDYATVQGTLIVVP